MSTWFAEIGLASAMVMGDSPTIGWGQCLGESKLLATRCSLRRRRVVFCAFFLTWYPPPCVYLVDFAPFNCQYSRQLAKALSSMSATRRARNQIAATRTSPASSRKVLDRQIVTNEKPPIRFDLAAINPLEQGRSL